MYQIQHALPIYLLVVLTSDCRTAAYIVRIYFSNYRSVHMRLYSMNKREFVMVFIVLLTAMGLVLFIGLTGLFCYRCCVSPKTVRSVLGPPITLTSKVSGVEVLKHINGSLPQGPYVMKTPSLTVYNQRLWLIAVVLTDNKDGL